MTTNPAGGSRPKVTIGQLKEKKLRKEPISCVTAYDYWSARLADEAGVDAILVGDSLAETVLGYENTLAVTVDEMLHHTKAARRGVKRALLIADLPYGSYHVNADETMRNATRFLKEAGAEVVKLEGGQKRADLVRRLVDAEIPVAGHIGLTPQSVHMMGGYKVQGKSMSAVEELTRDAVALDRAGACCIFLEGIPREVAALITSEVEVPTIGIGAGPDCDGQVLVFNDLLNLSFRPQAKFVRQYGDGAALVSRALQAFREDVEARQYPSDDESYHLPAEVRETLDTVMERKSAIRR